MRARAQWRKMRRGLPGWQGASMGVRGLVVGEGQQSAVSSAGDDSMESVEGAMGRQAGLLGITMLSNRLS